jgi:hypothetical protein
VQRSFWRSCTISHLTEGAMSSRQRRKNRITDERVTDLPRIKAIIADNDESFIGDLQSLLAER